MPISNGSFSKADDGPSWRRDVPVRSVLWLSFGGSRPRSPKSAAGEAGRVVHGVNGCHVGD